MNGQFFGEAHFALQTLNVPPVWWLIDIPTRSYLEQRIIAPKFGHGASDRRKVILKTQLDQLPAREKHANTQNNARTNRIPNSKQHQAKRIKSKPNSGPIHPAMYLTCHTSDQSKTLCALQIPVPLGFTKRRKPTHEDHYDSRKHCSVSSAPKNVMVSSVSHARKRQIYVSSRCLVAFWV
jgi:hypothetical protein